jgi:hypothetical protein
MNKNISLSALQLKQKIISTIRAPLFQECNIASIETQCKELLEDIRTNAEIINQIKHIDH